MTNPTGLMGVVGSRPERRPAPRPRSQIIQPPTIETLTYSQELRGGIATVTVTSSLSGVVYYHWYVNGSWVAVTVTNYYSFAAPIDGQDRVEVLVSNDANFGYPTTISTTPAVSVTVWWIRSAETDVREYLVEEQKDGGGWSEIVRVPFAPGAWDYRIQTEYLDDLADYEWRVTPVDLAGNEGSVLAVTARTIVRTPDAPDFTATFDSGTAKVTFAEAA